MEELTTLVQLAGGEQEAAIRLRAAGFRRAKDLAHANVDEISSRSGLSIAQARRIVRAAQDLLAPPVERKSAPIRNGLKGLPSTVLGGSTTKKPSSRPAKQVRPQPAMAKPAVQVGHGVSKAESSALTVEKRERKERGSNFFWRFG